MRLGENEGQRANFPCVVSGVRTPHVVYEDKGSSRGYVGDMVSPNGPLIFVIYLVKPLGVLVILWCPLHGMK